MRESSQNCIQIQEVTPSIFRYILEYLYTDEVQAIDPDEVLELLEVADRFLLFQLKLLIETALIQSLNNGNCEDFQELAIKFSLMNLLDHCKLNKFEVDQN